MKPSSTFPAVGDEQYFCGRHNGIWRTWIKRGGEISQVRSWGSKDQAFAVHESNIEVMKFKLRAGK